MFSLLPSKIRLDDLRLNQRNVSVITQKLTRSISCICLISFPYLSLVLLSPGPIWHHWEAHTIWPGAGGEVCEICEGEDRDWAKLCQTTEVGLAFVVVLPCCLPQMLLCASVLLKADGSACVCMGACQKAVYKMFVGSYDYFGTESNLSLKHWPHSPAAVCALSLPLSLFIHGAPSPNCIPVCQAHICCSAELCWRGEEVGADWHMTDWMWSERKREWKKEEKLF